MAPAELARLSNLAARCQWTSRLARCPAHAHRWARAWPQQKQRPGRTVQKETGDASGPPVGPYLPLTRLGWSSFPLARAFRWLELSRLGLVGDESLHVLEG